MSKKPILISCLIMAVSISVAFMVTSVWLFITGAIAGAAAFFLFTYMVGRPMLEEQRRHLDEREMLLDKFRNDLLEDQYNRIAAEQENPN